MLVKKREFLLLIDKNNSVYYQHNLILVLKFINYTKQITHILCNANICFDIKIKTKCSEVHLKIKENIFTDYNGT